MPTGIVAKEADVGCKQYESSAMKGMSNPWAREKSKGLKVDVTKSHPTSAEENFEELWAGSGMRNPIRLEAASKTACVIFITKP